MMTFTPKNEAPREKVVPTARAAKSGTSIPQYGDHHRSNNTSYQEHRVGHRLIVPKESISKSTPKSYPRKEGNGGNYGQVP